jgi:hypothetical protein
VNVRPAHPIWFVGLSCRLFGLLLARTPPNIAFSPSFFFAVFIVYSKRYGPEDVVVFIIFLVPLPPVSVLKGLSSFVELTTINGLFVELCYSLHRISCFRFVICQLLLTLTDFT